jgi:CubicO group peptidase (beta-lactamase class C family)
MLQDKLSEFVTTQATELGVPGVAVGVLLDGQEIYASHGVTSLANPAPVDEKTLFHLASVSKTFTATALMRLVAEGKVDLDAPVRRYVPELKLADEQAAAQITVLNLLNHTAGLDWNLIDDGEGDRSLAGLVAKLPQLPLIAPPGARSSYSQAGYNLAGRIVEKVTGLPFERGHGLARPGAGGPCGHRVRPVRGDGPQVRRGRQARRRGRTAPRPARECLINGGSADQGRDAT